MLAFKRASADCSAAARRRRAECVSTKANALRRKKYNSYLLVCRYVASQLDMFSLRSNSIYFAPQNSIFARRASNRYVAHGQRESIAPPPFVSSLALPSATHIERVSAISSRRLYRAAPRAAHIDCAEGGAYSSEKQKKDGPQLLIAGRLLMNICLYNTQII